MTSHKTLHRISRSTAKIRGSSTCYEATGDKLTKEIKFRLDVISNQPVVQIYTSNWLSIPRKVVHGGPTLLYDAHSAVAIELQGYVDAINNPAWGVDQICKRDVWVKWVWR